MTITIIPEATIDGMTFRATAGDSAASGPTVGSALDAIAAQLAHDETRSESSATLVIIQRFQPDRFFTAAQRDRLVELMAAWRAARDSGRPFPPEMQTELESLTQAELVGMTERSRALLDEDGK